MKRSVINSTFICIFLISICGATSVKAQHNSDLFQLIEELWPSQFFSNFVLLLAILKSVASIIPPIEYILGGVSGVVSKSTDTDSLRNIHIHVPIPNCTS